MFIQALPVASSSIRWRVNSPRRSLGGNTRAIPSKPTAMVSNYSNTEVALRSGLAVTGGAALLLLQPSIALADTAYFAGGNFSFLEKQYLDLKYAGVKEVVPGFAGPDGLESVKVEYNSDRIKFEQLVRTYLKYVNPTQADGQFSEKGPQYRSAVWVSGPEQRAFVEGSMAKLQRSGIFGSGPVVTEILDAPPVDFQPAREERLMVLKTQPKSLQKLAKARDAYFKDHWGFVQFCKDRVCGYVRFAPKCRGECEEVFPEYTERNFGVPEIDDTVKITKS